MLIELITCLFVVACVSLSISASDTFSEAIWDERPYDKLRFPDNYWLDKHHLAASIIGGLIAWLVCVFVS